ncbi:MAG TPA: ABC transporter permease [Candidatus Limnocylindrales bacterium]|nr:ABC transporter permease [Candidatus Limnocylindrales bacterium]
MVTRAAPVPERALVRRPPHPRFAGTVRGEILKLTRQRSTWVMLGIGVLLFLIVVAAMVSAPDSRDQLRQDPRAFFYLVLNVFLSVFDAGAGIFLLIVTARLTAMEYSSGTIRVLLARGLGRVTLLGAKLVTLTAAGTVLFAVFVAATTAAVYAFVVSSAGTFHPIAALPGTAWHNLELNLLIGLISVVVNILLATAVAVLGRSLAFGLGAALAFFPADNFGTIVLLLLERLTHQHFFAEISAYMLGPNLNVLQRVLETDHRAGVAFASPLVPVTATHALLVIAAWAVAFLALAISLTWRRDILE